MVGTLWKSVRVKNGKLWEPAPKCHRVRRRAWHQKVTMECLYEFAVTVLSTLPRDTRQFTFSPGGNWCAESKGVWRCRCSEWVSQPCGWHHVIKTAHPDWRSSSHTHTHTHVPLYFWHRTHWFLEARQLREPGSRLTTCDLFPFRLSPKVWGANVRWTECKSYLSYSLKSLNWNFLAWHKSC